MPGRRPANLEPLDRVFPEQRSYLATTPNLNDPQQTMRTLIATLAIVGCLGASAQTAVTAEEHAQKINDRVETTTAAMREQLQLADYEADKVQFINKRNFTAMAEVERLNPPDAKERMEMLWRNYEHSLKEALKPEQFAKWKSMQTTRN